MAGSLNKVMLIGNLGADPEVRRLNSGDPVVNLRIATSETWRDKSTGERRERGGGRIAGRGHAVLRHERGLSEILDRRGVGGSGGGYRRSAGCGQ